MAAGLRIVDSLGIGRVCRAEKESVRRRLHTALGVVGQEHLTDTQLQFISNGLELRVIELLESGHRDEVRTAAA